MQRSDIVHAYLEALGLQAQTPDLDFLGRLIERHVATFAFSSVGCRLGDALPLDLDALYDRIVVRRRGGYCFEQNGLMFEVLDELGYAPELYLARVIYNQDTTPGLTHRISIVELDGRRYVVDVGFGPLGPRVPVLLTGDECTDGDKVFRVSEREPRELHLQVLKDGDFYSLYKFELARYGQADCEVGHFYSHRHPKAAFVNHLVVSRILESETRSLRDLNYQVITAAGAREMDIVDAEQLAVVLAKELGIEVTKTECAELFEKVKCRTDR